MGLHQLRRSNRRQPNGPLQVHPEWREGLKWLIVPSAGKYPIIGKGAAPDARAIVATAGGQGLEYVANGGGDVVDLQWLGSTNRVTFFTVLLLRSAKPWASAMYDRNGVNGHAFGDSGLAYRYIWEGGEWNYDTGLTVPLGRVFACAHTITPTMAIFAVDGKTSVRSGLTNSSHSFTATAYIGQDINEAARTIDGHILMTGIVVGSPWDEARLRQFTAAPWSIIQRRPLRAYSASSAGLALTSLTMSNFTSSGARAALSITR